MANARVQRGRSSEEIVAAEFRLRGFPEAERRPASLPGSDIMHLPGLDVEVKARRGLNLTGWLDQQAKRVRDEDTIPLLVVRPDGYGPDRIARWPAVMALGEWIDTFGGLLT